MPKTVTTPWDPAEHLKNEEDMVAYLEAALEEGDSTLVAAALGDTARAKGMPEWRVILRHGLRNAILPIIAMVGLDVGIFMSGVVVVENVFGWPGIGQLMWQAIQSLDIPIIMGVTTVAAGFIVLGNLIADLLAPLIDPRIRLR